MDKDVHDDKVDADPRDDPDTKTCPLCKGTGRVWDRRAYKREHERKRRQRMKEQGK